MKAIIQILFLLFYIASAYTTGQERVARLVHKIQHPYSENDRPQIGSEQKGFSQGLPKFREAKKVNKDFDSRPNPNVVLEPIATTRTFTLPAVISITQFGLERSSPRAPPSLS